MRWKAFIQDYFGFSRKERIGILTISGVMLFIFLFPDMSSLSGKKDQVIQDTSWFAAVKRIEISREEKLNNQADESVSIYQQDRTTGSFFTRENSNPVLFEFDPNTISETGWQKLGLKNKTINTITNYLGKGGHFYKPEDLKKIYGLRKEEYEMLEPYIRIQRTKHSIQPFISEKNIEELKTKPVFEKTTIDINATDTTSLIALHGIGSKLANRIINFREKLGGFYSIEQVGETYGLPDSTFQNIRQYLKLENPQLKKIDINKATIDDFKSHPYISNSIAKTIIAYREEHGLFSSISDLKKIKIIDDMLFNKIEPYLIVQ